MEQNKSAVIITINNRINLEGKNIRSLEALYIRAYLISVNKYDKVDFLSDKTYKEMAFPFYKDYEDVRDINHYDEMYIHNSNTNFFGGIIKNDVILTIKLINEFKGQIYYVITDPKLKFVNFAKKIYERQNKKNVITQQQLTEQDVKQFENKTLTIKAIWTGNHYHKYLTLLKNDDVKLKLAYNMPLFQLIYKNKMQQLQTTQLPNAEKQYDLCYYGNNRGGYREKKINAYFNNRLFKKIIIGYQPKFECDYIDYVENDKLPGEIRKAKASIVIGDKEHNNNIITARFYENILYEILSFIDIEYDEEKTLYQNSMLKELMYVSNPYTLIKNLKYIENNNLTQAIIDLQKQELKRILEVV